MANGLANELELRKQQLELKFRDLLESCEIDIIHDEDKIDEIRRDVGLSAEQTRDIVLQLIRERKEQEFGKRKKQVLFLSKLRI